MTPPATGRASTHPPLPRRNGWNGGGVGGRGHWCAPSRPEELDIFRQKDGIVALVDKRWLHRSAALLQVDPRAFEAAVSVIAAATGPSSMTGSALLIKISEHVTRNQPGQKS